MDSGAAKSQTGLGLGNQVETSFLVSIQYQEWIECFEGDLG